MIVGGSSSNSHTFALHHSNVCFYFWVNKPMSETVYEISIIQSMWKARGQVFSQLTIIAMKKNIFIAHANCSSEKEVNDENFSAKFQIPVNFLSYTNDINQGEHYLTCLPCTLPLINKLTCLPWSYIFWASISFFLIMKLHFCFKTSTIVWFKIFYTY